MGKISLLNFNSEHVKLIMESLCGWGKAEGGRVGGSRLILFASFSVFSHFRGVVNFIISNNEYS